MSLCTDLTLVNANGNQGEIISLKCKRWSCKNCNPDNRWKVMQTAKRGLPNLFITLTVSDKRYESNEAQARAMKNGLVILRKKIAERWGVENIPFIVVFEAHKRGQPHMHLLLRGPYLHQPILKAMWRKIIGSGTVDIRYIKKKELVLFYITKYIGKDLHKFDGCKRWWRSQNYQVVEEDKDPMIMYSECLYISKATLEYWKQILGLDGWNMSSKDEFKLILHSRKGSWKFDNWKPPWAEDRAVKPSFMKMAGA